MVHNYYTNEDDIDSNNYKVDSNLKERYSAPDSDYDQNEDEINVDLSNVEMSESRDKLLKTKLADKVVPNVGSISKSNF